MSAYEQHKADAAALLARTNEKVRKDRFAREQAKRPPRQPLGWEDFYQLWLIGVLVAAFVLNSPWGSQQLLFNDLVAVRVTNLLLIGAFVAAAIIDVFLRESTATIVHYEVPEQCTTASEPSDVSSGSAPSSEPGESPPSTPWHKSWAGERP